MKNRKEIDPSAAVEACRVLNHPILQHNLTKLRNRETSPVDFRRVMDQLSALLEAVRPEADLLPAPNASIVPIQTVRDLQGSPGLVGEIHFRPSLYRKLNTRLAPLNRPQRPAVR